MSKTSKIKLKNLKKSFGKKHVLTGLDLDVKKGESFVIIGGSGTGKSVLLKCILGLIQPDNGSIKIDGVEVSDTKERPYEKFGMLFQGGALFDSLPIWENVAFGLLHGNKMYKDEARILAIEKLESVGLGEDIADHMPSEMSGGMQKRISLARAIATNPEIIFFDEPTTGLDPIMADVINDLIKKCVKEIGATAISITHDMASAKKIGDRAGMLYEGKLIWTDNVKKLDKSGNEYVDQFVHGRAKGPIKWVVK